MPDPIPRETVPPDPAAEKKQRIAIAKFRYGAWTVIKLAGIGILAWVVLSEATRVLLPALGTKLHKAPVPLFSLIARSQSGSKIDVANVLSLAVVFSTSFFLVEMLGFYLDPNMDRRHRWKPESYRQFIYMIGIAVVLADAALFFVGVSRLGWKTTGFSWPPLLMTVAYVVAFVFVSLLSLNLHRTLKELEESA